MASLVTATVMAVNTIEQNKENILKEIKVEFTDENANLVRAERFVYNDTPEDRKQLKSLLVANCKILLRSSNLEDTIDIGTRVNSEG